MDELIDKSVLQLLEISLRDGILLFLGPEGDFRKLDGNALHPDVVVIIGEEDIHHLVQDLLVVAELGDESVVVLRKQEGVPALRRVEPPGVEDEIGPEPLGAEKREKDELAGDGGDIVESPGERRDDDSVISVRRLQRMDLDGRYDAVVFPDQEVDDRLHGSVIWQRLFLLPQLVESDALASQAVDDGAALNPVVEDKNVRHQFQRNLKLRRDFLRLPVLFEGIGERGPGTGMRMPFVYLPDQFVDDGQLPLHLLDEGPLFVRRPVKAEPFWKRDVSPASVLVIDSAITADEDLPAERMGGHETGAVLADGVFPLVLGALLLDQVRQGVKIEGLPLMGELQGSPPQVDPDARVLGQVARILDKLPDGALSTPVVVLLDSLLDLVSGGFEHLEILLLFPGVPDALNIYLCIHG